MEREIIVVGAGPVGLTAALALPSLGRSVTVVEAEPQDRVRPGSRAIFIHRASLMVLENIQQGLGRQLNSHGLTWQTKRTLYRGREIFRRTYPPHRGNDLPAATSLPQVVTEQVLVRPGSRAIFIHGASRMVLGSIQQGLGRQLNSHGLTWQTKAVQ